MPTPSFILPSAPVYEEGTLYGLELYGSNFVPSPMSFTRATTATRVNADGLVELVPYNLLQRSNTFNNAAWGKLGTPTLTANYDTNPLTGENDAWRFQSSGVDDRIYQVLNNSFCTFSLYAKGSGNIRIQDSTSTHKTTLTLTSSWQRFLIYIPASFTNVQILSSPGGCDATIYGAQAVEGTDPLPYLKTETRLNRPRVDFSLGGCPNLLLEPQRTNTLIYSDQFDNAAWVNINGTITPNTIASPSGVSSADTFTDNSTNGLHAIVRYGQWSTTQQTFTIYVKPNTLTKFFIANGSTGDAVFFDLTTLTVEGYTSGLGNPMVNPTITPMANGWIRLSATHTATASQTLSFGFYKVFNATSLATTATYIGTGETAYIWGAQLEVGSYATSYIPTTSTSVTRNADVCVGAGNTATFNSTEGVLYVELSSNSIATFKNMSINSDGSNRINFFIYNSAVTVNFDVGGVTQASISYTIPSVTSFNKFAFSYKLNEFKLFVNGTQRGSTDTSGIVPPINTFNKFSFNDSFANNFYGNVKDLQIFTTALTDDQLEALTGEGFNTYAEMASYYNYTLQ